MHRADTAGVSMDEERAGGERSGIESEGVFTSRFDGPAEEKSDLAAQQVRDRHFGFAPRR